MEDALRATCDASGLAFAPHPERVPNTRLALELAEQARREGLHAAVHGRVMEAYWAEGRDIGDVEILRALARAAGMSEAGIRAALDERSLAPAVTGSTAQAQALGINAVPAFVIDRRVLVSGAQPHDVFERAFDHVATDEEPS